MKIRIGHVAVLVALAVGFGMLGCEKEGPLEPTVNCSTAISPLTRNIGSEGGLGTLTVSVSEGCAWTATSNAPWITITGGASGSGPANVRYTVLPNADTQPRTGTVTIGGQVHSIAQQGHVVVACTFELSPSSVSLGKEGGTGSFNVTAPTACSWTATSNAAWLTVAAGSQGSGNGTVSYAVAPNADPAGRSATIAVGDRTFSVTQFGDVTLCQYQVSPIEFNPCMAIPPSGSSTVTTQPSCPWRASATAPWITITDGLSGVGSGIIKFLFAPNWGFKRDGIVEVRWDTPTAGENIHIHQAGCTYTADPNKFQANKDGGPGSTWVYQSSDPNVCGGPLQNNCRWTADTFDRWITITTTVPRVGDDILHFTIAPNTTVADRTGFIQIHGEGADMGFGAVYFMITQRGGV